MTHAPFPRDPGEQLRQLDAAAKAQKDALRETLAAARHRLRPAILKERAQNRLLDSALDTFTRAENSVRQHPARAVGIAALIGAVLARGPLLRLAAAGISKGSHHVKTRLSAAAKPANNEDSDE